MGNCAFALTAVLFLLLVARLLSLLYSNASDLTYMRNELRQLRLDLLTQIPSDSLILTYDTTDAACQAYLLNTASNFVAESRRRLQQSNNPHHYHLKSKFDTYHRRLLEAGAEVEVPTAETQIHGPLHVLQSQSEQGILRMLEAIDQTRRRLTVSNSEADFVAFGGDGDYRIADAALLLPADTSAHMVRDIVSPLLVKDAIQAKLRQASTQGTDSDQMIEGMDAFPAPGLAAPIEIVSKRQDATLLLTDEVIVIPNAPKMIQGFEEGVEPLGPIQNQTILQSKWLKHVQIERLESSDAIDKHFLQQAAEAHPCVGHVEADTFILVPEDVMGLMRSLNTNTRGEQTRRRLSEFPNGIYIGENFDQNTDASWLDQVHTVVSTVVEAIEPVWNKWWSSLKAWANVYFSNEGIAPGHEDKVQFEIVPRHSPTPPTHLGNEFSIEPYKQINEGTPTDQNAAMMSSSEKQSFSTHLLDMLLNQRHSESDAQQAEHDLSQMVPPARRLTEDGDGGSSTFTDDLDAGTYTVIGNDLRQLPASNSSFNGSEIITKVQETSSFSLMNILSTITGIPFAESSPKAVNSLAGRSFVAPIAHAPPIPNDPKFSSQWHLNEDLPVAWQIRRERGQQFGALSEAIVAVIDTGCDTHHEELRQRLWRNENEICDNGIDDDGNGYVDDCHGFNFYAGNNNLTEERVHGTPVSGAILAETNNGFGVASICPHCRLMCARVGEKAFSTAAFTEGLNYAIGHGATVVNYSGNGPRSQLQASAIEKAKAAVIVTCAGNEGCDIDTPSCRIAAGFPGSLPYDNVLTIGAVQRNGDIQPYSNTGAVSVDLFAPSGLELPQPNGRFAVLQGTSFSSPVVAGVAGLIRSTFPTLTSQETIAAITESCLQNNSKYGDYARIIMCFIYSGKSVCPGVVDISAAMTAAGLRAARKVGVNGF